MQIAADASLLAIGDVDDLALELTPLRDIFEHQQSMRFSADLNRGDDAAGGEETAVAMHAVHVAREELGLGEPLVDLARASPRTHSRCSA